MLRFSGLVTFLIFPIGVGCNNNNPQNLAGDGTYLVTLCQGKAMGDHCSVNYQITTGQCSFDFIHSGYQWSPHCYADMALVPNSISSEQLFCMLYPPQNWGLQTSTCNNASDSCAIDSGSTEGVLNGICSTWKQLLNGASGPCGGVEELCNGKKPGDFCSSVTPFGGLGKCQLSGQTWTCAIPPPPSSPPPEPKFRNGLICIGNQSPIGCSQEGEACPQVQITSGSCQQIQCQD